MSLDDPMSQTGAVWCDQHQRWECSKTSQRHGGRSLTAATVPRTTMSHAPTTTSELLAVQDTLRAALCAAAEERPARWDRVTLPDGNTVPAWVTDEAKQMAAIVNEHRTRRGLDPVSLEHILRVEASAAGHADYAHKYALRCAQLALGEDEPNRTRRPGADG